MTGADRGCRGRLESLTHKLSAIAGAETRLITVPKTKASHAQIFKLDHSGGAAQRNARRKPTGTTGQFRLKQVSLPAGEFSVAGTQLETCILGEMNGLGEGITLSDKAMQVLDKLKSLEGDNAAKPGEAAPQGVAVKTAFLKANLKETIFDQSSDDARRKAADRAVAQLINAGKIGHLGEFLWTLSYVLT